MGEPRQKPAGTPASRTWLVSCAPMLILDPHRHSGEMIEWLKWGNEISLLFKLLSHGGHPILTFKGPILNGILDYTSTGHLNSVCSLSKNITAFVLVPKTKKLPTRKKTMPKYNQLLQRLEDQ